MLPLAAAVLSVAGCGSISNPIYGEDGIINDRSQNYEKAESAKRLELPPSLQARSKKMEDRLVVPSAGQTASQRTSEFEVPRPEFFYADAGSETVNLKRENGEKVLIVDEPVQDVWVQLQDFWRFNNVTLAKTAPREGVMETAWIDTNGKDYSFVDTLIKQLTFQDIEGDVSDKLRISVRPVRNDYNRTSIAMQHVRVEQDNKPAQVNWDESAEDVGYKSDMMFEMLRYLSKSGNKATTQNMLAQKQRMQQRPQLGRDSKGYPALKIKAPADQAWAQVDAALTRSSLDVGTRDQAAGIFYMTYTTSTPFEETEKMGFFEWLHSDRKAITFETPEIAKTLGFDTDEEEEESGVSYTRKEAEGKVSYLAAATGEADEREEYSVDDPNDPANKKGFKIWFAGRVIYNFEEGSDGVFNDESGKFEHVGKYQLMVNRTSDGVFLNVKTADGYAAPAVIADEILWEIKDNI